MLIKTKLRLGVIFLFVVLVVFGVVSMATINRLKTDAGFILKNNFESLVYSNAMLEALDKINDSAFKQSFENNLHKQQANITEEGEQGATEAVSRQFALLKIHPENDSLKILVRRGLLRINMLNQQAMLRKNNAAGDTAETANTWLMIIFSLLILIAFTISVNFPSIISGPVTTLTEGIRSIVNKDYSRRIHIDQKDEFGELAGAFNTMAEKLDEYEHSNLAQLKFEKSRIETIINQMKDGIIGLDDKSNILFLNAVAQQLLGLNQTDLAGKYAPDVALTNDLMRTVLTETDRPGEIKIFADNKESYFQLDALAVKNNGQVVGQVIILRNITPFHELNEAKTNFIATVSHELKTPIAAIKISTQLLADQRIGEVNAEQSNLISSINDDANRLLKITSELMNLSQVETGQIQLHLETVACGDIVSEAVHSVQYILQQKGLKLRQEMAGDVPAVIADKEKTSWVLINFLTNAIKHSLPNSDIFVHVEAVGNRVHFKVRDFGKGMEERFLSRIFERYYKIPGRLAPAGSGLGLSIAKEFIEAQSGHVWVDSTPGAGSTFGFDLPGVAG